MCSIGGIDCVPKWKHVLTPSGICLELKLQHDPDFQALGKLTLNSNVLGLIVSTNLRTVSFSNNILEVLVLGKMLGKKFKSDWTYGWHASRTGVVMYYYHVDQGIKFNCDYEISFLTTFGSREQNLKLEYRTKRTPDDKSYI